HRWCVLKREACIARRVVLILAGAARFVKPCCSASQRGGAGASAPKIIAVSALVLPSGGASSAARVQAAGDAHAALPFGLHCDLRELYTVCDGFLMPSGIGVYEVSALLERNRTFE